jgi:hypothetical protein
VGHLGEFLRELLQPGVVVGLDDEVVVVEFIEVEGLFDHFAIFCETSVMFLIYRVREVRVGDGERERHL